MLYEDLQTSLLIPEIIYPTAVAPKILANASWPPVYSTRVSARAKRISVLISPKRGLEIVLPKRKQPISLSRIEAVLQEHQQWIQKHLALWHFEQQQKQHLPLLPEILYFPAFEKQIRIVYQNTSSKQIRGKVSNTDFETFLLTGNLQDIPKIIIALKKYLFTEARNLLIPRLQDLSLVTGLGFSSAKIRSQTTLWGSCTAAKAISLNVKLLFLPKPLIDYVLFHELCHTRHLNHSDKFWRLLTLFDPDCLEHRRALRKASLFLPPWIQ